MRLKPTFNLHPNETISGAILRIHRHLRRLEAAYKPESMVAARISVKRSKPKLHLVK